MLGIMQGRFTDKGGFLPQDFPWDNWQDEFLTAAGCGIDCIEWMFNADMYTENPVWTAHGRRKILDAISGSGVAVSSICANYFMHHSLEKAVDAAYVLCRLEEAAAEIGASRIILPLFEESCIVEAGKICGILWKMIQKMCTGKVCLAFESDISAKDQKEICIMLNTDMAGICYDLGNAAGNGRDAAGELLELSDYLSEIHVKDKVPGGSSVMLGSGSVDFKEIFRTGSREDSRVYILESYFGENARLDTGKNIDFVRRMMHV